MLLYYNLALYLFILTIVVINIVLRFDKITLQNHTIHLTFLFLICVWGVIQKIWIYLLSALLRKSIKVLMVLLQIFPWILMIHVPSILTRRQNMISHFVHSFLCLIMHLYFYFSWWLSFIIPELKLYQIVGNYIRNIIVSKRL